MEMHRNIVLCLFALVASTNSQNTWDFWQDWFNRQGKSSFIEDRYGLLACSSVI